MRRRTPKPMDEEADREFLDELFQKYKRLLFYRAKRIVRDDGAAEDTVQNTFEGVIPHVAELRKMNEARRLAYIGAALYNKALKRKEKDEKVKTVSLEDWDTDSGPQAPNVEEIVFRKERTAALHRAMQGLRERDQQILRYRYYQDLSMAEIAEELSITPENAAVRLSRARERLKKAMHEEMQAEENSQE